MAGQRWLGGDLGRYAIFRRSARVAASLDKAVSDNWVGPMKLPPAEQNQALAEHQKRKEANI